MMKVNAESVSGDDSIEGFVNSKKTMHIKKENRIRDFLQF